jgi:hypothetical protein
VVAKTQKAKMADSLIEKAGRWCCVKTLGVLFPFGFAQGQDDGKNKQLQQQLRNQGVGLSVRG